MPNNRKPIIVSNPNDPRLQAYRDSLSLYNDYIRIKNDLIKQGYIPDNIYNSSFGNFSRNLFGTNDTNKYTNKKGVVNKGNNFYTIWDIDPNAVNKSILPQLFHTKIQPVGKEAYNDSNIYIGNAPKWYDTSLGIASDRRQIFNYSNVNPKQPYLYKPNTQPIVNKQPVISNNKTKKINKTYKKTKLNTIPDTRDKTIIEPLTPKQAKLNIEIPQDTLKPLPITNTVVPEVAPKKLPGGSGKFARYPNMKKQLGNLKTSRMVNAKKVENIVPTFVSGAKTVKQYRGDENLPEAKKGMKNCGCKHSRSKYKYQSGNKDIIADELEFENIVNPPSEFDELPDVPYDFPLPKPKAKINKVVSTKRNIVPTRTTIKKDTTPVQKKAYPTVSGEKKIYIENKPVSKKPEEINPNNPYSLRKQYTNRVKQHIGNYHYSDFLPKDTTYQLKDNKMIITPPAKVKFARKKLNFGYEDLSPKEQAQVMNEFKIQRAEDLRKEIERSNRNIKNRESYFLKNQPVNNIGSESRSDNYYLYNKKSTQEIIKDMGNPDNYRMYAKGTGAITIPEGSAIVTANGGKNKQALKAYKKGNYKLLNKIIDQMPEDNVDKAQAGEKEVIGGKQTFDIKASKKGKAKNRLDMTKRENAGEDIWKGDRYEKEWIPKVGAAIKDDAQYKNILNYLENYKGQDNATVKRILDLAKSKSPGEVKWAINKLATDKNVGPFHTIVKEAIDEGEKPKDVPVKLPPETLVMAPPVTKGGGDDNTGKRKEFVTLPSMAEIAARTSILGKGIEGVPENYLKLGRYQYASQLPKTLREIQLSEQASRESARDIVAGDAGRYLAQSGNLSAARMKAANEAVIQDTLARQDILNKNVDKGDLEAQFNTGLKNQYAQQRAMARAAYDQQLIGLGQRIDSATETAQEMSNQRDADEQRMQILKDLGQNYEYKNINGLLQLVPKVPVNAPPTTTTAPEKQSKKGLKKVKAYKRR